MGTIINQVAWSTLRQDVTLRWYESLFGFKSSGGFDLSGPEVAALHGLPVSESRLEWLVDARKGFQLEFFRFKNPTPQPRINQRQGTSVGYHSVSIAVLDFDAVISQARSLDGDEIGALSGSAGARTFTLRDPEGVVVQVLERDPRVSIPPAQLRSSIGASLCGVMVVVENLERALKMWQSVFDFVARPVTQYDTSQAEALGLRATGCKSVVLDGGYVLLEVVECHGPAARGWGPGHSITDQGLLNVAIGCAGLDEYHAQVERLGVAGWHLNQEFLVEGLGQTTYVVDPDGFSMEVMFTEPTALLETGFAIPEDTDNA